jgi:hypothetical protein
MRLKIVTFGLIATTFAQNDLISLLEQTPDLSTLLSVINSVPNLLNVSQDITILAPTNAAFEALSPESFEGQLVADEAYDAVLSYHVLVGLYPSTAAGEVPIFPRTLLNSDRYLDNGPAARVTPSNHVGLFTNGEDVQVLSGALSISTVTEAVRLSCFAFSSLKDADGVRRISGSAARLYTRSIQCFEFRKERPPQPASLV